MTHTDFFNWLRDQQDSKKLSQDMVNGANEMLALMTPDKLKDALIKINEWSDSSQAPSGKMELSKRGLDMINKYEGFRSAPYKDVVGVWTIGYGNTYYRDRSSVKGTDKHLTQAEAAKLKQDIINMDFAPAVNLMFADEIKSGFVNQNMFDALISLAYNIGTRGLAGSSITTQIKARNKVAAANAFLAWNKGRVNGKLEAIPGLTNRRKGERELFLA